MLSRSLQWVYHSIRLPAVRAVTVNQNNKSQTGQLNDELKITEASLSSGAADSGILSSDLFTLSLMNS